MFSGHSWIRILLWTLAGAAAVAVLVMGLPVLLPFGVGLAVALLAEPLAKLLNQKLSRGLASAVAVGSVYGALGTGLWFLGRGLLLELNRLTDRLPQLAQDAQGLLARGERWLRAMINRAPEHLRPAMEDGVEGLLSGGGDLAREAAGKVLGAVSRMVLGLPDTLVFLVTALTAGFLISARLPRLRPWLREKLPAGWREKLLPVLDNVKHNIRGWLRAQLKLMGLTFLVLWAGFLFLGRPKALPLALAVALVDALPMLGTGTILLPWAAVELLRGHGAMALGLGALYAVAMLSRSLLEPRLVGRQLGLSPIVTLGAVYCGYKLAGVLGMVLAPLLVVTVHQLRALGRAGSAR